MDCFEIEISDVSDDGVQISIEEEEKLLDLCGVGNKCKKRKSKKDKHYKKISKIGELCFDFAQRKGKENLNIFFSGSPQLWGYYGDCH